MSTASPASSPASGAAAATVTGTIAGASTVIDSILFRDAFGTPAPKPA